ncbi:hypothetical protein GCM10010136_13540 [Limoniibacter endophyticus]|uniref:Uncharacterized protein n=1 Tax=Limoniibacter endophyticus TaxID=1565040 RepID=A0A8J3DGQ7_9HYPH|nr:hypothetical protein GCM10010136_13540 [Limoniibacter endophyticus]
MGLFGLLGGSVFMLVAWKMKERKIVAASCVLVFVGAAAYAYAYPHWQNEAWTNGAWREARHP